MKIKIEPQNISVNGDHIQAISIYDNKASVQSRREARFMINIAFQMPIQDNSINYNMLRLTLKNKQKRDKLYNGIFKNWMENKSIKIKNDYEIEVYS